MISWILFGTIAGALTNLLDSSQVEGSLMGAILLGILGAFLGSVFANLLLGTTPGSFSLSTFLIAFLGATTLLLVGRLFRSI